MTLKNVEQLENNMAKLTIEVPADEVNKAIDNAYTKQKKKISVPGFRKGHVPKKIVEKMYGDGIFYEDAVNSMIPKAYADAAEESKLEIVAQPDIDVEQIEEGKEFIFTAEVVLKPEVTLGKYKGVEITRQTAEVTEEDINAELDKVRDQNARMISIDDRPVESGDQIVINFEGFLDGVAFEGGKGEDYPLTIGSGTFIPGFEDQLIGAKIGEPVEVKVSFPENYQSQELAGKDAEFQCLVKEIKLKELPELDDDFAQDVSEFDTLDEYKEDIKKNLAEKKEKEVKTQRENEAVDEVIADSKMDIHQKMIDAQVRNMLDEFSQRIQSQGLSFDQYMQYTGMTSDTLMEQMKPQALKRIQTRLVLEAIAKAEDIQVSDEDLEKELESMASTYQMEMDKLKELVGDKEKENIRKDIAVQKAIDLIVAQAVEVDKPKEESDGEQADDKEQEA